MHQPIRDNLEEYLRGFAGRTIPQEFSAHLAACPACANELRLVEKQAGMLRTFQVSGDAEPRPGFYARVMDRIEQQGPGSIWSVFLQPAFGMRLAVASATLVLLLGTYLVTTEPGDHAISADAIVLSPDSTSPD